MMLEETPGQALMGEKGTLIHSTRPANYLAVLSKTNTIDRVELKPGDYVTISASRYPFANVMPPGRRSEDWINSISRTLQWNSRQRQKAFQEWVGEKDAAEDDAGTRKSKEGRGGGNDKDIATVLDTVMDAKGDEKVS